MQRLEVSVAVRLVYGSLGVKRLTNGLIDSKERFSEDHKIAKNSNFFFKHLWHILLL